jgi:hypothetical protein
MTNKPKKNHQQALRLLVCFALIMTLYALPANSQQVHQLLYNNSNWTDLNLNGAITDSNTGIGAFLTPGAEHVYYLGSNQHVRQLYNVGGGWADQDLTAATAGPSAIPRSAVSGFSFQNFQYVYYVSHDQHIHQMLYNNVKWADSDLTGQTGGALSSSSTQLTAFATTPNNALHVYYMASDTHIHQLYNTGASWKDEDLTAETGGASGDGVWMGGFSIQNFQYIFFVATTGHVHEMYYDNSHWHDQDLTALTGTGAAAPGSGLAALRIPNTKKMRVYLINKKNHVLQLAAKNNAGWASSDLTKKSLAPAADPSNGITGFATTPNNQVHVYFVSGNHVNQLFFNGVNWADQDLTLLTGGGLANGVSGMAGFSDQNFQYVYYVAQ